MNVWHMQVHVPHTHVHAYTHTHTHTHKHTQGLTKEASGNLCTRLKRIVPFSPGSGSVALIGVVTRVPTVAVFQRTEREAKCIHKKEKKTNTLITQQLNATMLTSLWHYPYAYVCVPVHVEPLARV